VQDLSDPRGFGYGRATVQAEIGGRTYRLAALDGFEENVGAVYRTLGGRNTGRDPGDWMPMFGVLWPGAVALAERVAAEDVAGLDVLELGCGLGLPAIVAASRRARVVATDNHPHAGAFLAANARHNGVEVSFAELDWRDEDAVLPCPRFDRVIASDLLYSAQLVPLVVGQLARWLAEDGRAWLVDPGRLALPSFEAEARRVGLQVEVDVLDEGERELFGIDISW